MSLRRCFDVRDLRRAAQRRLPAPLFHYIDGGADDEWTLRRNTEAFDDYVLRPAVLTDVANIDLRTSIFGCTLDLPFFLSPTGMSKLFHRDRELGVARAAAKFGTLYSLSAMGTTRIEDVAAATTGPKMFQVYIFKDRSLTREFTERCKASKYDALCLTVDTPLAGNRERDRRTGMVMPPSLTMKSLVSFAASPAWAWHYLRDPAFSIANVTHRVDALGKGIGLIDYINQQFDRTLGWKDVEWLRQWWDGPLVIKGISTPEDARQARDAGATALMISNHGGRQLDGCAAPIECLRPIRDAIGGDLQLIVDGGIRRGTHILKALALGADACSVGRAYLYGLAAGGQAGVERALELLRDELLRDELLRDMALLGCARIADVVPSKVARLAS